MELCDDSLDNLLSEKTFDEKGVALKLREIISGIKALYERKILHRVLKPAN